jgi:aerobic-type carbon monoxide dehydrogenase small subunit (CoxS/CutS family)
LDAGGGRDRSGISRRDFLRGTVGGAVAAGLVPRARAGEPTPASPATEIRGPGEVEVSLQINGRVERLRIEPRLTLLDVLRERLGLTGAKRVCDRGCCGACTVLLDGRPVYACSVLALEAEGRPIATVESLRGADGGLHPVQAAFVQEDALQCGFCTPGFVMAAVGLLERVGDPTPRDLALGLGGNVCRCGTYAGIRRAIGEAARALRSARKARG